MRDNAQDANLSRRIGDRRGNAVSASTAPTASSAPAGGELSGRIDGASGLNLSRSAATAAATAARGTRLILKGRRKSAGPPPCGVSAVRSMSAFDPFLPLAA